MLDCKNRISKAIGVHSFNLKQALQTVSTSSSSSIRSTEEGFCCLSDNRRLFCSCTGS
jgi:hypothetical protein